MNNADLAITKLRSIQELVLDHNNSPKNSFDNITQSISIVGKASKEINELRETLNKLLQHLANKGGLTPEVISIFTDLDKNDELVLNISRIMEDSVNIK